MNIAIIITCLFISTAALTMVSCSHKSSGPGRATRPWGTTTCPRTDPFEESFCSQERVLYYVVPFDGRITVQLDTTRGPANPDELFDRHACLLRGSGWRALERGYYTFTLARGWTYYSAFSDLWADLNLKRVIPVYQQVRDDSVFQVTDLIEVQFRHIPISSMAQILGGHHLVLVGRVPSYEDRWVASIPGTDPGSPLACAAALCDEPEILWATPRKYYLDADSSE